MSLVWGEISPSTPHRGVSFRPRPHCGSKRKCIRIVLMRTVENGRKRIKMRVCSMCIEFNFRHNVQFYRFRTFHEKCGWTVKTYQNGSVDANRSMRFCTLLFSVDRALVTHNEATAIKFCSRVHIFVSYCLTTEQ